MRIVDLNSLATQAHENAVKHGWWEKERNNQHHLMLVIAEAVEADRDKKHARLSEFRDAKDKERAFRRFIKDSVEDELADVAIYLFDIAGKLGINFTVMRPCRYYRAFENSSSPTTPSACARACARKQSRLRSASRSRLITLSDGQSRWASTSSSSSRKR